MKADPFLTTLGLAARARKVVSGEEAVLRAIRTGQAKLVILARDAGPNTGKAVRDKCRSYGVTLIEGPDRYALGTAIGKASRVALAVVETGFARLLLEHLARAREAEREAP
ncbi:MAG: ribosomal L7Ae/L30e/S12e/Gadd45 family protein [Hydrogenibacillus schlegelii]|uniref:Ribosomal L7Ae/L30e/S12e/Gadd45 family protein n=1 Tax=Hydrogenibacillus schlegelii TaxID=1484 RepID=A0A947D2G8_HYDSH|nr:ribosomal L7Ae/L30e/S12e/Gadd45 family protein [Hydrogenibacillus schlegelii]MBT9282866.1 ribosomal L7Ae/L30e/S12e/Gadd45 family protein [Hydrogenibacillus schlegelii]